MSMSKVLGVFTLVLFIFSNSYSLYIEHSVQETQDIEKQLNSDYSISISGTLTITNPSNATTIDELNVKIDTPENVFGGFNNVDSTNNNSNVRLVYQGIQGFQFKPNTSVQVGYSFSGIIDESDFLNLNEGNTTFIETYLDPVYVMNPQISVDKPIMESQNQTIVDPSNSSQFIESANKTQFNSSDATRSISNEPLTSSNTRVVGSTVKNPSKFNLRGNFLEIQKSDSSNMSDTKYRLSEDLLYDVGVVENFTLEPYSQKIFNFYDRNSFEGAIYWVRSEVGAMWNWSTNISYSFSKITPSSNSGGGSGGSSGGGLPIGGGQGDSSTDSNLVITKSVDKFSVKRGENLTVTLRVMNLGGDALENISFKDTIPEGYSLVRVSNANVDGNKLDFSLDRLEGYSEIELEYVLVKNEDSSNSFTYFTPVEYEGDAILEGALVLEELLGDSSILVQKKVESIDSNFSRIKITVRNIGNNRIGNFKLTDKIDERYLIKEISQPFYEQNRGVWQIESLSPNQVYEVEYIVENHAAISQFPMIVEAEDSKVYTNVIIDSFVDSVLDTSSASFVPEKVGLFVALFLLLVYLLY